MESEVPVVVVSDCVSLLLLVTLLLIDSENELNVPLATA